ncbi:type I methionyl aminopeptidase [Candidatus Woesebacteria bacterium]|nr:type I methionyl aminopeptidase [Candidatus Woesebacteria bacterium]
MINIKTDKEIEKMREGGKKLAIIREKLRSKVVAGSTGKKLDALAEKLIKDAGGRPSFKKVKNYHWTTCININDGVVHGVPNSRVFVAGDVVSVDMGIFYEGFHTDTSFTVLVGKKNNRIQKFLKTGEKALEHAITQAKAGNHISDISKSIQKDLEKAGYTPVRSLTGHGIGRKLHEAPQIPCFWESGAGKGELIPKGAVLAIEVIYTIGSSDLVYSGDDNWTIGTEDGRIAGLFEETVAVTNKGPLVLTESDSASSA